jgi:hypothetical protein
VHDPHVHANFGALQLRVHEKSECVLTSAAKPYFREYKLHSMTVTECEQYRSQGSENFPIF